MALAFAWINGNGWEVARGWGWGGNGALLEAGNPVVGEIPLVVESMEVGLEGGSSLIRLSSRYFGSRLSSVREGDGGLRKSFFLELLELLLPSSEMSFMNVLKSMLSFSASNSLKARTSSPRLLSKSPFLSSLSRNFN